MENNILFKYLIFIATSLLITTINCNPIQVRHEESTNHDHQQPSPSNHRVLYNNEEPLETSSSVNIFLNRTKYPTIFTSSSSPGQPSGHRPSNSNNGQFSWTVNSGQQQPRWRVPLTSTPFSIHTSSITPSSRVYFPNDPIINFKQTTIYPPGSTSRNTYNGYNNNDDGDDPDVVGGPKEITRYSNTGSNNGHWPSTIPTLNLSINPTTNAADDDENDDYTDNPVNVGNTTTSFGSTTSFAGSNDDDDHPNSIYRSSILVPSIDPSSGKPSCVTSNQETFCESVNNYPKIDLKKDIKMSMSDFREIFGSESIEGRKTYQDDDDIVEERVCRRIPKIVYPQMARNNNNQWVYIVNDVEYVQAVVSEICQNDGKPCSYMDNLPEGTYSRCKQKYSYKKLLAIHPTEQRTYTDTFSFPSCCACYVKGPGLRLK